MKLIGRLIAEAFARVRQAGPGAVTVTLLVQILIVVVAFPVIRWIFHEAIRASGMVALDLSALEASGGLVLTLGLLIVLTTLVFWLLSAQFTVIVLLLRPKSTPGVKQLGQELRRVLAKVVRPSSFGLVGYLLLVLPLAGFGFTSFFLQHITIPSFISGELMKSVNTQIMWVVFTLIIGTLNLRWALTLPIFALTDATGGQALRRSWRLTRGIRSLSLLLAGGAIIIIVSFAMIVIFGLSLVPVRVSDAVAP